ncbi:MAG: hypothetical protein WDW38_000797 [Sanguina aurantia]
MSNGRLKAEYNRVRTSSALQGNNMWNNTIGITDTNAGSNSVIEASLRAPGGGGGGGGGKDRKRERAQQLIEASGYQQAVTSYEGLMSLARAQGGGGGGTRGACKICGGLGHLTKQCKNGVSGHVAGTADLDAAAAHAVGIALLPDPGTISDLTDSSDDSDSSGSSSDGDSDDSGRKRRRKSSSGSGGSKHKSSSKEEKRRKEKKREKKEKKEKRERKERREKHKSSKKSRQ